MMTENWVLSFLALFPLIGVACFARVQQGSWYAPGAFFCLLWSGYVFLPLMFLPEQYIWLGSIIAIVLASVAVCVGSLISSSVSWSLPSQSREGSGIDVSSGQRKIRAQLPGIVWLTVISSVLGVGAVIVVANAEGYTLGDLASGESIAAIGYSFSVARYAEDYSPPLLAQVLSIFMYAAALFGGILFAQARTRRQSLLAFIPFVPALFFTIIFTTRASILFQGVLWLSACMANEVYLHGPGRPLFTKRFNLIMLLVGPLLFGIVVTALVIRFGEGFEIFESRVLPNILVDAGGHLAGFSSWLETSWQKDIAPGFGFYTFAGVFDLLGIQTRTQGIYEELVDIGSGDEVIVTNISTALRGVIQDCSVPFSAVGFCMMGLIAGYAYQRVSRGRLLTLPILASFYSFALFSHIVSFTVYNSLLGAYGILFTYIIVVALDKAAGTSGRF